MKHFSHLNTATRILTLYTGAEPFSIFLKEYFRADKKYGSRDRKAISQLCYVFFRLGVAAKDLELADRVVLGLFLCATGASELLEGLKPEWNEHAGSTLDKKLEVLDRSISVESIFPFTKSLSNEIDVAIFCKSHLTQPDLFVRLRPSRERLVKEKLTKAGLNFSLIGDSCVELPNASKIEDVIEIDRDAVVQDLNSQRTAEFFDKVINLKEGHLQAWDCCAASGGKSIMLYDYAPGVSLTVSDRRISILHNLKKRFQVAGIKSYESFVADLSKSLDAGKIALQDLIIADLPCTGSGTWARTPEQLYFFDERLIEEYAEKQRSILSTILPKVRPGGYILYITCSVFREENEGAVEFILSQSKFRLIEQKLLIGYDRKADSLFGALLCRDKD